MSGAPSTSPATSTAPAESVPATGYDLASHFLLAHQGKDPQALHALVQQLVQQYGPDVVRAAVQHLIFVTEEIRWRSHAALAMATNQQVPSIHPYFSQQNPFPPPNYAAAAQAIAAFNTSNHPAT